MNVGAFFCMNASRSFMRIARATTRIIARGCCCLPIFSHTKRQYEALSAASVFHDCCRFDDGRDVGHGQRAADRYRSVCGTLGLAYDELVFFIMAYHDRHDREGEEVLSRRFGDASERAVFLYHLFKDADALDRFRFGPHELNETYLRTNEARALIPFAKFLNGMEV